MSIEEPRNSAEETPKMGKSQIIGGIVTVAVLGIIFLGILPQFTNYADAWDALQRIETLGLIVLSLGVLVNVLVYVWPYQAALPGLHYWPGFVVRQTSFLISNTVPAGGAIGLGVQYAMLSDYGFGAAPATAAIGITGLWNLAVTLALPWLAIVGVVLTGQTAGAPITAAVVGLIVIIGGIVVLTLILRSEDTARRIGETTDRIINGVVHRFKRDLDINLTKTIIDFRASTVDVIRERWVLVTVTNFGQQLAQFAILALAIYALQDTSWDPVNLVEALAAFSFARLLSFIPITPGGLGTVDAAMIAFLTGFGASSADATAAVLLWRALTFFPQVAIGIITFLIWRRKRSRARAVPPASP